jgi:hypothetical protein
MKLKKGMKVEDLYPNKRCRDFADKAIDTIPVSEPMSAFLDAWDAAYVYAGGKSPWRKSV